MFSTVRGKECGSITKSKKDIGVSAVDKRENTLQHGHRQPLLRPKPRDQYSSCRAVPSVQLPGVTAGSLLEGGVPTGPAASNREQGHKVPTHDFSLQRLSQHKMVQRTRSSPAGDARAVRTGVPGDHWPDASYLCAAGTTVRVEEPRGTRMFTR